jgi:hypothetical protein
MRLQRTHEFQAPTCAHSPAECANNLRAAPVVCSFVAGLIVLIGQDFPLWVRIMCVSAAGAHLHPSHAAAGGAHSGGAQLRQRLTAFSGGGGGRGADADVDHTLGGLLVLEDTQPPKGMFVC